MITAQDRLEINLAMAEVADARSDMRRFLLAHACPLCEPQRFDGSQAVLPAATFCQAHQHGELARIYRALGITGRGELTAKSASNAELSDRRENL